MLLFLGTAFTHVVDIDLISIGFVSADGERTFYAERSDYRQDWLSDFARAAVVPQLGKVPACTREALISSLRAWFASLPPYVQIAVDSPYDRDLLWDLFDNDLPPNLTTTVVDLRALIKDEDPFSRAVANYHAQRGRPWHHALHMAHANRAGWIAWISAR